MKLTYLYTIIFIVTLFSCDSDDTSTDDGEEEAEGQTDQVFFPLTAGSYWTYTNQDEQLGASRDSLFVAGTQMENGNLFTNLDAEVPASAFMSQFLSDNIIRTTNTQLLIDGALGSPIEGLTDITLPLNDFLLYNTTTDITVDPVLDNSAGSITQEIMEVPIDINYSITSIMLATPSTSTESAPQIASQLIVNMEIIAMVPVGPITVPFTVMQAQDVLIATNIYTDGIGLTNSQVLIEYALEDLSPLGVELPFPESSSISSSQNIDTFFIGEE